MVLDGGDLANLVSVAAILDLVLLALVVPFESLVQYETCGIRLVCMVLFADHMLHLARLKILRRCPDVVQSAKVPLQVVVIQITLWVIRDALPVQVFVKVVSGILV